MWPIKMSERISYQFEQTIMCFGLLNELNEWLDGQIIKRGENAPF
jgi:hypothetical protein